MLTLTRRGVRVEWVNLDEGWSGDYNPEDPKDENLLRFDVSRFNHLTKAWYAIEDASYCTRVPADTPVTKLKKLLALIMDRVGDDVRVGRSIKRLCEELSWIEPAWLDKVS